ARSGDVLYYLNPNNFFDDPQQQFQFLDVSRNSGAAESILNNYLSGKGTLDVQASAFISAGLMHGVNDTYLISPAILETGHGTSELATGVEVGKNKSGNAVLATSNNKSSLTDIKTVYNMYGIGAFDDCALSCGAKRAYEEGWTTPEKAITGGA